MWRLQWWIAGSPSVNLQSLFLFTSLLKKTHRRKSSLFAQRPLIADFLHRIDCLVSSYRCTLELLQGICSVTLKVWVKLWGFAVDMGCDWHPEEEELRSPKEAGVNRVSVQNIHTYITYIFVTHRIIWEVAYPIGTLGSFPMAGPHAQRVEIAKVDWWKPFRLKRSNKRGRRETIIAFKLQQIHSQDCLRALLNCLEICSANIYIYISILCTCVSELCFEILGKAWCNWDSCHNSISTADSLAESVVGFSSSWKFSSPGLHGVVW